MPEITLPTLTAQHPYPAYAAWWPLGNDFVHTMAAAITGAWQALSPGAPDFSSVQAHAAGYIETVYRRTARPDLVEAFTARQPGPLFSGEFDALSYAFYRRAFEAIAGRGGAYGLPTAPARREFTRRVGRAFFAALQSHLRLSIPSQLNTPSDFALLQENLRLLGDFLLEQGYLQGHFAFTFQVAADRGGTRVLQDSADFLGNLHTRGVAYALYEMGFPVILPSAVYLYQMLGEAQHHSSRLMEELFARVGCRASETGDFDPTGFPPGRVVELWEIRPMRGNSE